MKSPLSNLPGWDIAERIVSDDEEFRRAFALMPKYTLPRAAESLALKVGELAGELRRGVA